MDTQLFHLLQNHLDVQLHQLAGNMIFDYTNKLIACIVGIASLIIVGFIGIAAWNFFRVKISKEEIENIAKKQVDSAKKEIAEYVKQEIGISKQTIKDETDGRIKLFNGELDKKIIETQELIRVQGIKSTIEAWEVERKMYISNKKFYLAFQGGVFALAIAELFEPITKIDYKIDTILSDMKECLKHLNEEINLFTNRIDEINKIFKKITISKFPTDTQKEIITIQAEVNSKVEEFKKKQGG